MSKTETIATPPAQEYVIQHTAVGHRRDGGGPHLQGARVAAADLFPGELDPEPHLQRLLDLGAIRKAEDPPSTPNSAPPLARDPRRPGEGVGRGVLSHRGSTGDRD